MRGMTIVFEADALSPGAELCGRVEWDTVTEVPEALWISLLWHTEGKGTEDSDTLEQLRVPSPGISGSHNFSFRLPTYPWSFSGTLISLVWKVEARLEGTSVLLGAPFVMAPNGREIRLRPVDEP